MRVATLNLFANPHGRWDDREALVVDQARALDADVYTFQELTAGGRQLDRLLEGIGRGHVGVQLDDPDPDGIKSLAIVTRLAVSEHDACTDLADGDMALRARLEDEDGGAVTVVTTHLHYGPTAAGSEVRLRQVERLCEWLDDGDGATVLTGDFNATPGGATVARLERRFRSAHAAVHGREPPRTHPTPLLHALPIEAFGVDFATGTGVPIPDGTAIDYVFVAGGIDVLACSLAWDAPSSVEPDLYPSDHFGLVADLALPGDPR